MSDCLLKDQLEKLLSEGFEDQIEVIVESREANPEEILENNRSVQYLGLDLYSLEIEHHELEILSERVDSIEKDGTGKSLTLLDSESERYSPQSYR